VSAAEDVLEIPEAGIRLEVRRRAADTGGEYVEFDTIGRPRGLFARSHVHSHLEILEVVTGALRLRLDGRERVLRRGERVEIPAGGAHWQRAEPGEPYHIRVQWWPPGGGEAFGERLAEISRQGGITRFGYPRPLAAARFVLEFGRYTCPAWPSLRVQLASAAAVVRAAGALERLRG
jgi:quercetin dioxygenase-like cupin family protein